MIMTYSTDLRKRVLDFINTGGSKAAAKRTFGISRRTIYNWLETEDPLASEKPGPKGPETLITMCCSNMSPIPQMPPSQNVPNTSVFPKGVSRMPLRNSTSREKKSLTYKEQCPAKRQVYLDALALEVQAKGKTPVYVDESGFSNAEVRRYAYAPKGICVSDKISGCIGMPPRL